MSSNKSSWNLGNDWFMSNRSAVPSLEQFFHRNLANLRLIAMNRFKWEGLPLGVTSRKIEEYLLEHGEVGVYNSKTTGLLILPSGGLDLNVYGEPTRLKLTGIGFSKIVPIRNTERCLANDLARPKMVDISYYAERLAKLDKAMAMNLKQTAQPFMIPTTKDTELSMKNIMEKVFDDNVSSIYVDKNLDRGQYPQVLDTKAEYLIDKYQQHKLDIMNEFLTMMGLNNTSANNNKKERLVVAEVQVNNGEILFQLDLEYKHRQDFCDRVNAKFGTNMTVTKVIEDIQEQIADMLPGLEDEGNEGGE